MPIIHVHISEETLQTLEEVSRVTGRAVDELASAAVEDAAIRSRRDDSDFQTQLSFNHG